MSKQIRRGRRSAQGPAKILPFKPKEGSVFDGRISDAEVVDFRARRWGWKRPSGDVTPFDEVQRELREADPGRWISCAEVMRRLAEKENGPSRSAAQALWRAAA